ncbi:MAG: M48 family metalloprotease [Fimbriimonadaceae bacterium]
MSIGSWSDWSRQSDDGASAGELFWRSVVRRVSASGSDDCVLHAGLPPRVHALVAEAWAKADAPDPVEIQEPPAPAPAPDATAPDEPSSRSVRETIWPQLDRRHRDDLARDAELGQQYSQMVERELKLSKNAEKVALVERIGQELAAIANRTPVRTLWGDSRLNPFDYTFRVVEGKSVNAFSLPGGFIYVYEGLIDYAETEHELAGVLAHEIAHASFRHVATLAREQSRFDLLTLPAILVTIFSGGRQGTEALVLSQLAGQAAQSGWSQRAEKAADLGGFEYLRHSEYNPVGMLTFLERLARDQRSREAIDWGIFRTHPPSRDRADLLIQYLRAGDMPIRRSEVSTSFRVTLREPEESPGRVEAHFNGRVVFLFAGPDAKERAEEALPRLNEFFDRVPELFDVTQRGDAIVGKGRVLFRVSPYDAEAINMTVDEAAADAVRSLKRSLYMLAFRVWDAR